MRDPNRIDEFCKELAEMWYKVPDQRFSQFMMNVLGEINTNHGDPWFYEESKFLEYMKEISWLKDDN